MNPEKDTNSSYATRQTLVIYYSHLIVLKGKQKPQRRLLDPMFPREVGV